MPALLNAMSSRPNSATVRSTRAATWSSSETSQATPSARWPAAVSSSVAARERLLVDVGEHDRGAGLGERARGGESHAGAGAGDQRDLAAEVVGRVRAGRIHGVDHHLDRLALVHRAVAVGHPVEIDVRSKTRPGSIRPSRMSGSSSSM